VVLVALLREHETVAHTHKVPTLSLLKNYSVQTRAGSLGQITGAVDHAITYSDMCGRLVPSTYALAVVLVRPKWQFSNGASEITAYLGIIPPTYYVW
jgi:hypothetical protein